MHAGREAKRKEEEEEEEEECKEIGCTDSSLFSYASLGLRSMTFCHECPCHRKASEDYTSRFVFVTLCQHSHEHC